MALVIVRKNGEKVRIGDVLVQVWIAGRNKVKLVCDGPKVVQLIRTESNDRADSESKDPD